MTLNKTQLVNLLAAQLGSTKTDCDKFLTGLTVVVTAALKGGNDALTLTDVYTDSGIADGGAGVNPFTDGGLNTGTLTLKRLV